MNILWPGLLQLLDRASYSQTSLFLSFSFTFFFHPTDPKSAKQRVRRYRKKRGKWPYSWIKGPRNYLSQHVHYVVTSRRNYGGKEHNHASTTVEQKRVKKQSVNECTLIRWSTRKAQNLRSAVTWKRENTKQDIYVVYTYTWRPITWQLISYKRGVVGLITGMIFLFTS